jgi:hypothetical protein
MFHQQQFLYFSIFSIFKYFYLINIIFLLFYFTIIIPLIETRSARDYDGFLAPDSLKPISWYFLN